MDSAHCTFLELTFWNVILKGSTFPAKCQLSSGPGLLRSLPWLFDRWIKQTAHGAAPDVEAGTGHPASGWFPFATSATRVALRSGPGDPVFPEGWLLIR